MGNNYWGGCYVIGLAFFVLACVMPLKLEWGAPLAFGLLVGRHPDHASAYAYAAWAKKQERKTTRPSVNGRLCKRRRGSVAKLDKVFRILSVHPQDSE